VYNPSHSSTSALVGQNFSLRYAGGSSVNGTTYTDSVIVGGLTATCQTLGVATSYSTGLSASNFTPDGLLGLGWSQISHYNASGYFQTLIAEGKAPSRVFSFKLATSGSELYIGGTDKALYNGTFTWVPVTKEVSLSHTLSLSLLTIF
jgi:cathepsin D